MKEHELIIITPEGTLKRTWYEKKPITVAECRALFDQYRKLGYMAYTVEGEDLSEGTIITRFSAKAERIALMRPIAGG